MYNRSYTTTVVQIWQSIQQIHTYKIQTYKQTKQHTTTEYDKNGRYSGQTITQDSVAPPESPPTAESSRPSPISTSDLYFERRV